MDQDLGWWVRIGLDGWHTRDGPRYRQIAATLADTIERRLVGTGVRLPAERLVAQALGVSRGTAVRAYDDLAQSGLVERRQGAGTFVRPKPPWTHTAHRTPYGPDQPRVTLPAQHARRDRDTIDLSFPVPAGTGHLPLVEPLSLAELGEAADGGHGLGEPAGLRTLREALATHLTHRVGVATSPDQLIVTSGAQQAISLIVEAMVPPGRTIIAGCPAYAGLAAAVALRRGRMVGVPVDHHGIDVHAVDRAASHTHAPVIYVDSAAHDPTGAVLSRLRAERLLSVARRRDALIVEDLSQAGLGLVATAPNGEPARPLVASDTSVIAIGSLSRTFWAGLRIGWLRAPTPLRGRFLRLRAALDLAPSVPAQVMATRLLTAVDTAWYEGVRRALRARRDLLLDCLERRLPAWTPQIPAAGPSTWVTLPLPETDTFAHRAAEDHGIVVTPASALCFDSRHRDALRLSYAASSTTLRAAVDRLADAWEEHNRRRGAGTP
ncbi:PLP-dependent aminotransferase family protein [Yinghuangia sp. ASG 101]|uniref:aminotransferase-like domain-containing protein n=1 Tax=Yinghuangia sp. ASG 101 TaxID=2896848 RepID=UPI001E4B1833|nr:PLP-dependent aminotransferase family protein [Yinghuangia sp. ASG 101]UGQ10408.1 PLP-dependent aminotransferase family protein [Yinghuangia sp. ASG 101]